MDFLIIVMVLLMAMILGGFFICVILPTFKKATGIGNRKEVGNDKS